MSSKTTLKSFVNSIKNNNSESFSKAVEQMTVSFKSTPSIISKGTRIEGEINSSGIIEIEGEIKGQIIGNSIIIREDGIVNGDINCDNLNISGNFTGSIKANSINIFNKAQINGNIEYQSLSVEDGASIEGQFKQLSKKESNK